MSWWKKIINQIKEEDDVVPSSNNKPVEKAKVPFKENEEKEIKARISYQYPQNSTFPVKIEIEKRKERKRSWEREEVVKDVSREKVDVKEKVNEVVKQEKTRKMEQVEKKYFKKPFHRTEVPSPIYGFHHNRREQWTEELPEIELTPFNNQNVDLNEHYTENHFDSIQNQSIIEQTSNESLTDQQQINHEFTGEVEQVVEQMKKEYMLPDEQEVEIIDADLDQQEIEITNEGQSATDALMEVEMENDLMQQKVETEELFTSDISVNKVEIDNVSVQPETETITEERVNADHLANADVNVQQIDTNKEVIVTSNEKEVEISPQREQITEKSKNYIPFNVMMLEKDRKMMRKNLSSETSKTGYTKPNLTFLNIPPQISNDDQHWVEEQKKLLDETLQHFRVGAKVVHATQGPSVTQYEVQPDPGVKVNKITNLSDDIKLSLAARDIRIEAPIPGKNTIGIEVPNKVSKPVVLREILRQPLFVQHPSPLAVALGLDISGKPVVLDLMKMPHGLIAGATGSGKSVCVNSIIVSLLFKANPEEVKLLLIDPKMVELTPYNHIPHLVSPVITDVKAATAALKWAVEEMERRYELFVHAQVRDIARFNEKAEQHHQEKLPYLVIVIDELADLMMMAPSDVEDAICRIAQKARACGIHLLIATQRPSVDVITGLIKANIPTRIAFSVSSQVDSRTIIDISGAERLLGKGDMLFLQNGAPKPVRVQGNFVSDEEIEKVVTHVKAQQEPSYMFEQEELLKEHDEHQDEDELFGEACQFVVEQDGASTSSLQRRFRIGYNRAARLIDMMEAQGIISSSRGSKPRDVLIQETDLGKLNNVNK